MPRKRWPKDVEVQILLGSRRRCALCFVLNGDATVKRGQIAHIDRNPSNNSEENGAWLCTPHHDEYDSVSRQTKRYTPEELRACRAKLLEHMAEPIVWTDTAKSLPRRRVDGVSLDVHDRRIPIYRTARDFIRLNTRGDQLQIQELFKFANDTDEALFLFDERVANYLVELYRQANRLRYTHLMIAPVDKRTPELIQENAELLLWFTEQFEEMRRVFAPYLQISDGRH